MSWSRRPLEEGEEVLLGSGATDDGRVYFGIVVEVDHDEGRCLVRFGDCTERWSDCRAVRRLDGDDDDGEGGDAGGGGDVDEDMPPDLGPPEATLPPPPPRPSAPPSCSSSSSRLNDEEDEDEDDDGGGEEDFGVQVSDDEDDDLDDEDYRESMPLKKLKWKRKRKKKKQKDFASPKPPRPRKMARMEPVEVPKHVMESRKELPYDFESLVWDDAHQRNDQERYCYCGESGDWYKKMLQCNRCWQWFHQECLRHKTAQHLLFGDRFFAFVCALCSGTRQSKTGRQEETVRRLDLSWIEATHLVLFNLTVINNKKYHDLETSVVPFFRKKFEALKGPAGHLRRSKVEAKFLNDLLVGNKSRFKCGSEIKKRSTFWGLRKVAPPAVPTKFGLFQNASAAHPNSVANGSAPAAAAATSDPQQSASSTSSSSSSSINYKCKLDSKQHQRLRRQLIAAAAASCGKMPHHSKKSSSSLKKPAVAKKRGRPPRQKRQDNGGGGANDGTGKSEVAGGTLDSLIPPPKNFEGFNNPYLEVATGSTTTPAASSSEAASPESAKSGLLMIRDPASMPPPPLTALAAAAKKEPPDPSSASADLKSFFGGEARIGRGERFSVAARRLDGDGDVQFLIEWDQPGPLSPPLLASPTSSTASSLPSPAASPSSKLSPCKPAKSSSPARTPPHLSPKKPAALSPSTPRRAGSASPTALVIDLDGLGERCPKRSPGGKIPAVKGASPLPASSSVSPGGRGKFPVIISLRSPIKKATSGSSSNNVAKKTASVRPPPAPAPSKASVIELFPVKRKLDPEGSPEVRAPPEKKSVVIRKDVDDEVLVLNGDGVGDGSKKEDIDDDIVIVEEVKKSPPSKNVDKVTNGSNSNNPSSNSDKSTNSKLISDKKDSTPGEAVGIKGAKVIGEDERKAPAPAKPVVLEKREDEAMAKDKAVAEPDKDLEARAKEYSSSLWRPVTAVAVAPPAPPGVSIGRLIKSGEKIGGKAEEAAAASPIPAKVFYNKTGEMDKVKADQEATEVTKLGSADKDLAGTGREPEVKELSEDAAEAARPLSEEGDPKLENPCEQMKKAESHEADDGPSKEADQKPSAAAPQDIPAGEGVAAAGASSSLSARDPAESSMAAAENPASKDSGGCQPAVLPGPSKDEVKSCSSDKLPPAAAPKDTPPTSASSGSDLQTAPAKDKDGCKADVDRLTPGRDLAEAPVANGEVVGGKPDAGEGKEATKLAERSSQRPGGEGKSPAPQSSEGSTKKPEEENVKASCNGVVQEASQVSSKKPGQVPSEESGKASGQRSVAPFKEPVKPAPSDKDESESSGREEPPKEPSEDPSEEVQAKEPSKKIGSESILQPTHLGNLSKVTGSSGHGEGTSSESSQLPKDLPGKKAEPSEQPAGGALDKKLDQSSCQEQGSTVTGSEDDPKTVLESSKEQDGKLTKEQSKDPSKEPCNGPTEEICKKLSKSSEANSEPSKCSGKEPSEELDKGLSKKDEENKEPPSNEANKNTSKEPSEEDPGKSPKDAKEPSKSSTNEANKLPCESSEEANKEPSKSSTKEAKEEPSKRSADGADKEPSKSFIKEANQEASKSPREANEEASKSSKEEKKESSTNSKEANKEPSKSLSDVAIKEPNKSSSKDCNNEPGGKPCKTPSHEDGQKSSKELATEGKEVTSGNSDQEPKKVPAKNPVGGTKKDGQSSEKTDRPSKDLNKAPYKNEPSKESGKKAAAAGQENGTGASKGSSSAKAGPGLANGSAAAPGPKVQPDKATLLRSLREEGSTGRVAGCSNKTPVILIPLCKPKPSSSS